VFTKEEERADALRSHRSSANTWGGLMQPFLYASDNPQRAKAIATEIESIICNLFFYRSLLPTSRAATQETLELALDVWLTVNGYDNRLHIPEVA
jgi:hypothetical protein